MDIFALIYYPPQENYVETVMGIWKVIYVYIYKINQIFKLYLT